MTIPKEPQFVEPHPLPEGGERTYFSQDKFVSPFDARVTRSVEESKRESDTAGLVTSGVNLKDLAKKHAEFEANRGSDWTSQQQDNPYDIEISGDAASRAIAGQPAKDKWDIKKGEAGY